MSGLGQNLPLINNATAHLLRDDGGLGPLSIRADPPLRPRIRLRGQVAPVDPISAVSSLECPSSTTQNASQRSKREGTHKSTSNASNTTSAMFPSASTISSFSFAVALSSKSLGSDAGNFDGSISVPARGVPGVGRTKEARRGGLSLRKPRRRSDSQLNLGRPATASR